MAIETITNVTEPEDKNYHGGLYIVTIKEHTTPIYMYKDQLHLLQYENWLRSQGISEIFIEKHRDLVIDHVQNEQERDGECG